MTLTTTITNTTPTHQPPPPPIDPEILVYSLGFNLAKQLPSNLPKLLTEEELVICMKGVSTISVYPEHARPH